MSPVFRYLEGCDLIQIHGSLAESRGCGSWHLVVGRGDGEVGDEFSDTQVEHELDSERDALWCIRTRHGISRMCHESVTRLITGLLIYISLSVPAVESQSYSMYELTTIILPVPAVESGTGDINTYLYETILVDSPQSYSMYELTTEESHSVSACTHNAPQFLWVHV
jgi:hypothetical protein